jgi:hypothetical protein
MTKYLLIAALAILSMTSFIALSKKDFKEAKHNASASKDYAFVIFYKIQGEAFVSSIFCFYPNDFTNGYGKTIEYALTEWARNAIMNATGNSDISKMNYQCFYTTDFSYPVNKKDEFNSKRTQEIAREKMTNHPVTIVNVQSCYVKDK